MNLDGSKVVVLLNGALADAVGRNEWTVHVNSPAEALQAVDTMSGGQLVLHLMEDVFACYRVLLNGRDISSHHDLQMLCESGTLEIVPILKGRGSDIGAWLLIIGLVIVAAVFTFGFSTAATPGLVGAYGAVQGSAVASFFLTLGATIALSGLAQLVAPSQKFDNQEREENKPSYIFNGAVNTYRQGNPVQVGFGGPLTLGSQVVSAGILNVDYVQADEKFDYEVFEQRPTSGSDLPPESQGLEIPLTIQTNDPSGLQQGTAENTVT